MDHASASFASPWAAAVLGGHAMGSTNTEHGFGHHGLSMDLHGYSYYRCERKTSKKFHAFHTTNAINKADKKRISSVWCDLWVSLSFVPHEKLTMKNFYSSMRPQKKNLWDDVQVLFTISRSEFFCYIFEQISRQRHICISYQASSFSW